VRKISDNFLRMAAQDRNKWKEMVKCGLDSLSFPSVYLTVSAY